MITTMEWMLKISCCAYRNSSGKQTAVLLTCLQKLFLKSKKQYNEWDFIYKVFQSFSSVDIVNFRVEVKMLLNSPGAFPQGYISHLLCTSENAMFPKALQMLIVHGFSRGEISHFCSPSPLLQSPPKPWRIPKVCKLQSDRFYQAKCAKTASTSVKTIVGAIQSF